MTRNERIAEAIKARLMEEWQSYGPHRAVDVTDIAAMDLVAVVSGVQVDGALLHDAAMDAIHERAGVRRDGLAAILAWIDEAKEAVVRLRIARAKGPASKRPLRRRLVALVRELEQEAAGWRADHAEGPEVDYASGLLSAAHDLESALCE